MISQLDPDSIARAMRDIPMIFEQDTCYSLGSYAGKHDVEHWRKEEDEEQDYYVSNGDFIMAMLLSGFPVRFRKQGHECRDQGQAQEGGGGTEGQALGVRH